MRNTQHIPRCASLVLGLLSCGWGVATAQMSTSLAQSVVDQTTLSTGSYKLGVEDSLKILVADEPTIPPGPYAIDLNGQLKVPELGSVHAAGLTVDELSSALTLRAKAFLQNPMLSISVAEFRSQRVSVLGEVTIPGVQQIRGRKTLFEAISDAGGLRSTAGGHITLTRRMEWGAIPLPGTKLDMSKSFSIADISVDELMNGRNPVRNIELMPDDMLTVAKAQMVYVIGAVNRAGGFELSERDTMSVLQALALAQGMARTAGSRNAKILRATDGSSARKEVAFDLNKVMRGQAPDLSLRGDDILFIPNSVAKSAGLKTLDVLVATGSGVAMYHVY